MTQRNDHSTPTEPAISVAHLTTVDMSLRFLLWPQLLAVVQSGGHAYGISSPGPWVDELEEAGVKHIPLRSSTRGASFAADVRAAAELWRAIRRTPLTVLHTHNPKPGIYGRILGRLAGVPVVVNTLHGFYATEDDPPVKRALVYGLEAVASRFSDAELHQNPEDLSLATRRGIVPRSKGRLLGNGIDLGRFDPARVSEETRRRVRDGLGATEEDIVVGTVGRLVAEKGYLELFEVAQELGKDLIFLVIGPADSDKPDAIQPEVIARARDSGVRFLGMRTDMEELYSAMDIFVLPSYREGFPRAAMEAAAMGLPLVASDIRGCRQVVDDGVNGVLVPVRRPDLLREAISSLAGDGELRSKMSNASRSIALNEFDERRVVRVVMETYRDVLASKGLTHLMPSTFEDDGDLWLREARPDDVRGLANLHFDLIAGGFLPSLGRRFLRVLYRGLQQWTGTAAFVAEDSAGLAGFVVGVGDVSSFYRWFLKKYWLQAGIAVLPALLRPGNVKRAWESLRYGGDVGEFASAEVLSLGVAARARGRGVSGLLLEAVLDRLNHSGPESVRVVVGSSNSTAIGAYEKVGFMRSGTIEVHRGEQSEVLLWDPG